MPALFVTAALVLGNFLAIPGFMIGSFCIICFGMLAVTICYPVFFHQALYDEQTRQSLSKNFLDIVAKSSLPTLFLINGFEVVLLMQWYSAGYIFLAGMFLPFIALSFVGLIIKTLLHISKANHN